MQNYKQRGDILTFTAPVGGVVSGTAYLIGSLLVVATATVAAGLEFEGLVTGVVTLPKTSAQAWTEGQKIYWNDAAAGAGGQVCTSDSTLGQLVGVASAAAANPSSTGYVRLNGVAPAASEGPQAAEADLTDSSGGAVADGTIGAVTAPAAITDNSGGVDPGDNTIAVVTPAAAITDSSGGTDPGDDTIAAVTNAANAGSADLAPTTAAIAQLAAKQNTTTTAITAVSAAVAQLAAKQNVDRTAIVALTDAIKELSTKQNAILAKLRAAGVIAAA